MSWLSRITEKIVPRNIVTKSTDSMGWDWFDVRDKYSQMNNNGGLGTLTPKLSVQQTFQRNVSWVHAAIDLIQRKVVETDYYLYREIGQPNDEEYDRILNHPLIRLLKRPNRFQSGRQFRQITQVHLDLTGMAFWLILYNGLNVPGELHILNPAWLTQIVRGDRSDNLIEGFSFAPPYQRQMARKYAWGEVVYFHYPDPSDHILPLSPLQSIATTVDIDMMLGSYEKTFFMNNARPDFVFKSAPGQIIPPEEAERMQAEWEARHRGPGKSFRPAVLSGGLDVQPLGMSARDFEFGALTEHVKDQILATYGIPEAELGLFESFNKASSIASERAFVKSCIQPRLIMWEDVINSQLLPLYQNSDGLEFRHESALPKDDEWEMTETQANLQMGITTINEQRKKRGWKPFDSAMCDVPWGPDGMPIRGVSKEADKLAEEKMAAMMGGAGAAGAAQGGGAPPAGGGAPGGGMDMAAMMGGGGGGTPAAPPQPASSAPAAQGAMGSLGGRPEGQALSTLLTSASRRTNEGLSMLLNAARGKRGGLAELLKNHPEEVDLSSLLDKNRSGDGLSKLIGGSKGYTTKGLESLTAAEQKQIREAIYEGIEADLGGDDKLMFRPYERMISRLDLYEDELEASLNAFFVRKGNELALTAKSLVDDFVTKGPDFELKDYSVDYTRVMEMPITKAVEIGFHGGYEIVRKAGGEVEEPEQAAVEAAGRLLHNSADLNEEKTKRRITEVIQEGVSEGWSTDDVADAIRDKFREFSGPRTKMIARTEMAAALNTGLDSSFRKMNESGLIVKQAAVWTALDERVCDECESKHGDIYADYVKDTVNESAELPVHPNCRCVFKPVLAGG